MIDITKVKEELLEKVKELDDNMARRLLDEWEDILLQIKLESDEDFLKNVEEARKGIGLTDHEDLKKELGL